MLLLEGQLTESCPVVASSLMSNWLVIITVMVMVMVMVIITLMVIVMVMMLVVVAVMERMMLLRLMHWVKGRR